MIRTDRKTGEPILSPKLTADQLHAMANDPGWRPWMRLIAGHPHAWPALIDWWHNAQRQGFDAAGAAPKPPESMRRRRRVAIPSAPLPPEDEPGQEPVPASMESVDETRTTEPEPSRSQSSVSGSSHEPETEQSHPDDSAEKALKDVDGDFAALEQVADPEPTAMSLPPISGPEPAETGKTERPGGLSAAVTYSADLDDLKVRRVFPVGKALVAIVMAASLIAVSWIGLQIKTRHAAAVRQEAHETAISACDSAEATRKTIQSDLDRTTAKASKLLKDTSRGQVADPKKLDALNRLLDAKTTAIKGSCAPDAAAFDRTTKELKNRLTDLKTATKAVTDSKLDKTVDDANTLYKETDGRVADDKTRASLLDAIEKRDADAIAKAVKEVNESKAAKEKADAEAKAKAEQEAAAAAAAQQAQASQSQSASQRQTPSYSGGSQSQSQGSSGSGSGTGRRPSSGGASSSTNTGEASPGWSVPAPSDEGTGLPGSDPGL